MAHNAARKHFHLDGFFIFLPCIYYCYFSCEASRGLALRDARQRDDATGRPEAAEEFCLANAVAVAIERPPAAGTAADELQWRSHSASDSGNGERRRRRRLRQLRTQRKRRRNSRPSFVAPLDSFAANLSEHEKKESGTSRIDWQMFSLRYCAFRLVWIGLRGDFVLRHSGRRLTSSPASRRARRLIALAHRLDAIRRRGAVLRAGVVAGRARCARDSIRRPGHFPLEQEMSHYRSGWHTSDRP